MTDFCTFCSNFLRRDLRFAATFAAVLLALLATAAQADAWKEFEARCLTPMEEVSLALPDDLEADGHFKNDGDTYSTYAFAGFGIAISDGRGDRPHWCFVSTEPAASQVFQERADAWRSSAIAEETYELIGELDPGFHLRSTEWREPRIDVVLTMGDAGTSFNMRVEETDLEG